MQFRELRDVNHSVMLFCPSGCDTSIIWKVWFVTLMLLHCCMGFIAVFVKSPWLLAVGAIAHGEASRCSRIVDVYCRTPVRSLFHSNACISYLPTSILVPCIRGITFCARRVRARPLALVVCRSHRLARGRYENVLGIVILHNNGNLL